MTKNIYSVNISNIKDAQGLHFVPFNHLFYTGWVDVYYAGVRIAIINGMVSALQWLSPSEKVVVPGKVLNYLEDVVKDNLIR